jgi:predicted transcriptional regulator
MPFPKFTIRGYKAPREAVLASLGDLERKALEEVWRRKETDVRGVLASLNGDFAYTTIMTTLDRLYKKGYLDRRKEKRAFVYTPRMSPEQLRVGLAGDMIVGLLDGATKNVEPVLACIVDAVSDRDCELLDELERLVKEKKASLDRKLK